MAEVAWARTALNDLVAIAEYIAIYNPTAASELVRRITKHVGKLADHPKLGTPLSIATARRYRQVIEPPCRIIYRQRGDTVLIIAVQRFEQRLKIEDV